MHAKIVCFGETLWDIFPDKKVIGGAPLNVSLRLHSLGAKVRMISCVGADKDGDNLVEYLSTRGIETDGIQVNQESPTGNVQVHLDQNNTATYTISEPVAWDHIETKEKDVEQILEADAFVFGSLACRNDISKNTLLQYLEKARFKVFDANLRAPFYQIDSIIEFMHKADFIKLNDEELHEIIQFMDISIKGIQAQIKYLSQCTNTDHICITLGANGAVLYTNSLIYRNKGYKVKVQDTVGAGDSFLASLIFQLLANEEPNTALNFACAMGSLVASKTGAIATVTEIEINQLQRLSDD